MTHRTHPELLRAAMIATGIGTEPVISNAQALWPIYVDHLPAKPDMAICVYNTPGIKEGRMMRTGESIRKPGWQIRVRAHDYTQVWSKVNQIQKYLDTIHRTSVNIEGDLFIIQSVTQIGDALNLGQENDADRRNNVTINGTITL